MAERDSVPWWVCPNQPRCPHGALLHDIEDWDDESPTCCVDGCLCGRAATRAANEEGDRD